MRAQATGSEEEERERDQVEVQEVRGYRWSDSLGDISY